MSDKWKNQLRSDEEQVAESVRQNKFIEEAKEIVSSISDDIGRPLFSHTSTFGCEMNPVSVISC